MSSRVALLDREVEPRGVARARDNAAPDLARVCQHNRAVQHGPAEEQRRGDGRVERLVAAQAQHGLAAKAQDRLTAKTRDVEIFARQKCQREG